MKGRIHNNYEGRLQHPELTGQRFGTKSVTSQFKHSPTSTPEHPSSWITGGCHPRCSKVLARPGLELRSSVYMIDTLPTELLTMPAEMSETVVVLYYKTL